MTLISHGVPPLGASNKGGVEKQAIFELVRNPGFQLVSN